MKIPTQNLTWYEKIDLTNKLTTGLIPQGYEGNGEVPEILWLTDNLLRLTPEQRIDTAIKLLKQIQKTHFFKTD
ncbi:MAG: hypothetical protein AAGJ08_16390 [Cyanobacteria bacterium P01_H01_bin.35]